jgi:hypothetical protein
MTRESWKKGILARHQPLKPSQHPAPQYSVSMKGRVKRFMVKQIVIPPDEVCAFEIYRRLSIGARPNLAQISSPRVVS